MHPLLIVAGLLSIVYLICRNLNRLRGLPPGPTPLPLLGNVLQLNTDMTKALLKLKEQYGKMYTLWLPYPHVIVNDSKILKEITTKYGEAFAGRTPPEEFLKLCCGGNYGLILNDNNMWQEQRRFALHSLRDLGFGTTDMQSTIAFLAHRTVEELKKQNGKPIDICPHLTSAVGNVVTQLVFGKISEYDNKDIHHFKDCFSAVAEASGQPLFMAMEFIPALKYLDGWIDVGVSKLQKANDQILDYMEQELCEHEKNIDYDAPAKCYVDAYLQEMKRRKDKGEPIDSFTRHQLKIAVYDMYGAGLDTTVTTLLFTIHYFLNNHEVQEKVIKEIDEKIGKREVRMDDQKLLPYVNAVIQEIHRLSNIVPIIFGRCLMEPIDIEGYHFPAGLTLVPQFPSIHLDPEQFERPNYFCPERHINEKGEFEKDPRITPFSVGKRSCLGEPLAKMEVFLFLVTFMQYFRFVPVGLIPPPLEVEPGLLRHPKTFQLRAVLRE